MKVWVIEFRHVPGPRNLALVPSKELLAVCERDLGKPVILSDLEESMKAAGFTWYEMTQERLDEVNRNQAARVKLLERNLP